MRRSTPFVVVSALLAPLACDSPTVPETGQILLYVDTDAPIAGAGGARPGYDDPFPLFDRVRIEVIPAGAVAPCDACVDDFAIDADRLRSGASVGIVPPSSKSGYRARVRMYRLAFSTPSGDPDPSTSIDVTVALPPIERLGIVELTALLPTDAVGQPMGIDAPIEPLRGRPSKSLVGSWPPAQRVSCAGDPSDDEVCVPGGAYWMGNPRSTELGFEDEGTKPKLVTLSPFFLQKTEVTVAEFRKSGVTPTYAWSGSVTGTSVRDWCTFAPKKRACGGTFPCDDDVLNCITWKEARAYCRALGRDLPTEAQYEYAASGLESRRFVWGEEDPICADAVYGIGGDGILLGVAALCFGPGHGGPKAPGTGARDLLTLPTGTIVDLAGNLQEWALDTWNRKDEPCWSLHGVYADPLCLQPSPKDGALKTVRGGTWINNIRSLQASTRYKEIGALDRVADVDVGFRCARADAP